MKIVTPGKELEVVTSACRLFKPLQGITSTMVQEARRLPMLHNYYPMSVLHAIYDVVESDFPSTAVYENVSFAKMLCNINEAVVEASRGQSGSAVNASKEEFQQALNCMFDDYQIPDSPYKTLDKLNVVPDDAITVATRCLLNRPFKELSGVVGILGANLILSRVSEYTLPKRYWLQLPDLDSHYARDMYSLMESDGKLSEKGMNALLRCFCLYKEQKDV